MYFFSEQLTELFRARIRRKFQRGLKRQPLALIKRLRKAKKEAPPLEKPEVSIMELHDDPFPNKALFFMCL